MASSASAVLQLELQANGENASTWGTKTNTNLKILEDAIGGTESITLSSSDVTLTDTQFTFGQQSHAAVLELSGTLGANVNIIVPTRSKTYLVKNGCTGAFTVTIKTASGTGAIADQGVTTLVRCDGTNVVRNDAVNRMAFYEGSITCSADVTTAITFSTSNRVHDEHGLINTSNNRFEAPADGKLAFVVVNFVGVMSSSNTVGGIVEQNGTSYGGSSNPPAAWGDQGEDPDGNGKRGTVAFLTPISSGDYFDFKLRASETKTISFSVYAEIIR